MILTLEIGGSEAENLGSRRRKVFKSTGGTIGRSPDCDWALPDQFISGRHAVINYVGGVFSIEDADSTNGVYVNSLDNRLAKGQPHELKSGDLILIDPYEITASISEDQVSPSPPVRGRAPAYSTADDPFAPLESEPAPAALPMDTAGLMDEFAGDPNEEVDPLAWLGGNKASAKDVRRAADLQHKPVMSEHYAPPKPKYIPAEPMAAASGVIPDDWLEDRVEAPKPSPPAARSDPRVMRQRNVVKDAPPVHESSGDLQAVLEGAGLRNVQATPELAHDFGEIIRIVVAGLMDVLQARQRLKSEFRIGMTMFKAADNNPLKFSANVDDALHNLLVKRNAAYLGPVDAFEDAFDDVRNHQVALLAGVRVAFEAMLAEFDPDRLQAEFDKQLKKGSLIPTPARLRYWDLYREKIHDIVRDPETAFRQLFGEEFAQAYEEQLSALKARGRAAHPQQRT